MGEVKPINFRIDQETAEQFRQFCADQGMSQAQGFDHIMQVVELDRAKAATPERLTEIETFEKSMKDALNAYVRSIEINQNAESRIREQFASALDRKDKSIDDLQQKVAQLQTEKAAAEQTAAEAAKAKELAEKAAAAAEQMRDAAERTAADKQTIAEVLTAKLTEAEMKAEGFDDLKTALAAEVEARKNAEQRIKDVERDAADAAKDAAREAEKATEQAVRECSAALQPQIDALKDELRKAKSEADAARVAEESARAAAIAELAEAHRVEVAELHAKLDELRARLDTRTDELMQARQELSDLQLQLQAQQSKQ